MDDGPEIMPPMPPMPPTPAEIAATTKAAGTKAKLIADWGAPGTLGGLRDVADVAYTLSIKRNNPHDG